MRDFEDIGKALEKSGKAGELKALADSPEGKRLAGQLDAAAIERAAKSGDTEALQSLVRQVLSTEDGKALARRLSEMMGK